MHSTALSLTGILRSSTDDFPKQNPVLEHRSFLNLKLSFIYSLSESESIMNCSVQILYKKDEEKRLLSELVIADLAFPGDLWEILDMLCDLGIVLMDQGRYKSVEDVACRLVEGRRSRLGNGSDDAHMLVALSLLGYVMSSHELHDQVEALF